MISQLGIGVSAPGLSIIGSVTMPSPASGAVSQGSSDSPSCDAPRHNLINASNDPISRFVTQDWHWGSLNLGGFAGRGCLLLKFRPSCNQVGPLPISAFYTKCYARASSSLLSQHCSTTVTLFTRGLGPAFHSFFVQSLFTLPRSFVKTRRTGSSQATNQILTKPLFQRKTKHDNKAICSSRL